MKKIILTNNKKVQNQLNDKANIIFMENATPYEIYDEGRKVAENGGKLMMDPTIGNIKSYYKSLIFLEGDGDPSHTKSLELLDKCLNVTKNMEKGKEPLLSSIMQNKEVDAISKILA